jgi:hypothetical protein
MLGSGILGSGILGSGILGSGILLRSTSYIPEVVLRLNTYIIPVDVCVGTR